MLFAVCILYTYPPVRRVSLESHELISVFILVCVRGFEPLRSLRASDFQGRRYDLTELYTDFNGAYEGFRSLYLVIDSDVLSRLSYIGKFMVPRAGLKPAHLVSQRSQRCRSSNSLHLGKNSLLRAQVSNLASRINSPLPTPSLLPRSNEFFLFIVQFWRRRLVTIQPLQCFKLPIIHLIYSGLLWSG